MANDDNKRTVAVGVFSDREQAEKVVGYLRAAGFRDDQIGILMRAEGVVQSANRETHAEVGAAVGAVSGGAVGALAGLAALSGFIPGIGPIVAGGALTALLSSTAIGMAAGGIIGTLVGLGVPEEEAQYFETEFAQGRMIVTVRANGRYNEAVEILRQHGAMNSPTYASPISAQAPWIP
jgi:Heat induced stress protein YflT domain